MTTHPARYSQSILDYFATIIPSFVHVHDPYGGDGKRLGALCDALGVTFSGTEIEPAYIIDKRVRVGNSRHAKSYPWRRVKGIIWIVTSPVYPNGIADHFMSSPEDTSSRKTYRHAKAEITGQRDAVLDGDNMGRYGYRNSGPGSAKRKAYWELAEACVQQWEPADCVVLNVSDFISKYKGEEYVEPLVNDWIALMKRNGWKVVKRKKVKTPRYKNGSDASRDRRVDGEMVITFKRAA